MPGCCGVDISFFHRLDLFEDSKEQDVMAKMAEDHALVWHSSVRAIFKNLNVIAISFQGIRYDALRLEEHLYSLIVALASIRHCIYKHVFCNP